MNPWHSIPRGGKRERGEGKIERNRKGKNGIGKSKEVGVEEKNEMALGNRQAKREERR